MEKAELDLSQFFKFKPDRRREREKLMISKHRGVKLNIDFI